MADSILDDTKKLLGIDSDYTVFDRDIIMHINGVFMTLNQLGVGPEKPFVISSSSETWTAFSQEETVEAVKTYMYLKVRLAFDPPTIGAVMSAHKELISELEWRLNVQVDSEVEDEFT